MTISTKYRVVTNPQELINLVREERLRLQDEPTPCEQMGYKERELLKEIKSGPESYWMRDDRVALISQIYGNDVINRVIRTFEDAGWTVKYCSAVEYGTGFGELHNIKTCEQAEAIFRDIWTLTMPTNAIDRLLIPVTEPIDSGKTLRLCLVDIDIEPSNESPL